MAGAAIAPALGIIKAHFSDAPAMLIQFIVSMPALLIIITNLFFLPLSRVMRTRAIATTGLLLYVVAGAGCFFVDDIYLLLFMWGSSYTTSWTFGNDRVELCFPGLSFRTVSTSDGVAVAA